MAYKRGSRSSVVRSGLRRVGYYSAAGSGIRYGMRKISSYFKPKRGGRRISVLSRLRRRTGSYTATARRRRKNTGNAENMSSNYVKFVYGYGPRRKPRLSKSLAPISIYRNGTARLTAEMARQGYHTPIVLYDQNELSDIDAQLPSGSNQWTRHLGCTLKMMFTNQSEAPAKVLIYHLLARRDGDRAPIDQWTQGCASMFGNSLVPSFVGQTPRCVQQFTQFFVVKKTSMVDLPPGGNMTCTVVSKNYATIKEQMFRQNPKYYSGLTYIPLIVIHGYPLNDSQVRTKVTTAECAVDMVWTKTHYFTYVERTVQSGNRENTLTALDIIPISIKQEDGSIDTMQVT